MSSDEFPVGARHRRVALGVPHDPEPRPPPVAQRLDHAVVGPGHGLKLVPQVGVEQTLVVVAVDCAAVGSDQGAGHPVAHRRVAGNRPHGTALEVVEHLQAAAEAEHRQAVGGGVWWSPLAPLVMASVSPLVS